MGHDRSGERDGSLAARKIKKMHKHTYHMKTFALFRKQTNRSTSHDETAKEREAHPGSCTKVRFQTLTDMRNEEHLAAVF